MLLMNCNLFRVSAWRLIWHVHRRECK